MASGQQATFLREIHQLFAAGTVVGRGDDELVKQFAARRDEAAFAALLNRHGSMVLGVCRRRLRDSRDAEDAFQATFLVLIRKAGSIKKPHLLGPWLYGVADRVAHRAQRLAARRDVRERTGVITESADVEHEGQAGQSAEHAELAPSSIRKSIVCRKCCGCRSCSATSKGSRSPRRQFGSGLRQTVYAADWPGRVKRCGRG